MSIRDKLSVLQAERDIRRAENDARMYRLMKNTLFAALGVFAAIYLLLAAMVMR
ncbi:MAG: hypothetical protein IJS28_03365 [Synergistaceae bacterium]|nr:hypothetical protein [Synergistaceae bacterium]